MNLFDKESKCEKKKFLGGRSGEKVRSGRVSDFFDKLTKIQNLKKRERRKGREAGGLVGVSHFFLTK